MRNGELRELCGFDPAKGAEAVPSESAYTRFMKNLFRCGSEIEGMFDVLLDRLGEVLPELGRHLAIDSKAIRSVGKPSDKDPDGRRDRDGDWGVKSYRGMDENGRLWERVKRWFGYKVHLIVDTVYEVAVGFEVTRASSSDTTRLLPMMERLKDRHGGRRADPFVVSGSGGQYCDRRGGIDFLCAPINERCPSDRDGADGVLWV